jgi:diaminohydroxyphosphoribosylaminopyrimidine deaminase / 5-amino-6-(5-phosphoribosylamino)uracil reductase
MSFSDFDQRAMARALALAERGLYTTHPNPRVGAVLAVGEEIVGEGFHARAGEPHAEVFALREAGERARGATAYVTLEPCSHFGRTPPCADALLAAGVTRVVYASPDPNPRVNGAGASRLAAAGVRVESGLSGAEADALNAGFFKRMKRGLPFVRLKSAASLDGRVALANGASQWVTSDAARADVQHWRAQSGAVLTSAATVMADDPRLDVRLDASLTTRQPLRVVLDRTLATAPGARIFAPPGEVLVFASEGTAGAPAGTHGGARVESVPLVQGHLDFVRVLERLGALQINEVFIEGGSRFVAAWLASGLVDEWLLYIAPKLLGADALPLADFGGLADMDSAPGFEIHDTVRVGPDLRLRLLPK